MATDGIVREWNDDEGWGVIDSAETPGGCWAHFSHIVMEGYRSLRPGEHVTFSHEAAAQDGFGHRASRVWPAGAGPDTPVRGERRTGPSAYQSRLTIHWDRDSS
jgi:cold shock protein